MVKTGPSKSFKEYLEEVPEHISFPLWKPKPQWGVDVAAEIKIYDELWVDGIIHPDNKRQNEKE